MIRTCSALTLAALLPLAAGCVDTAPETDNTAFGDVAGASELTAAEVSPQKLVMLESAISNVELGKELEAARTQLNQLMTDAELTVEHQLDARLALARAFSALGDEQAAITTTEEAVALSAGVRGPQAEAARLQLRELLTGETEEPRRTPENVTVPPVAMQLAKSFSTDEQGKASVRILTFGTDAGWSDKLGVYEIGAALRERQQLECPLCEDLSISTSKSSHGSWTSLPATRGSSVDGPRIEDSVVVFSFDLGSNRVPSRYDAVLPMPSDEIAARLQNNSGLIVAKEREGAPPVIVVAAPRAGQLARVFEAFAQLEALPTEPVEVEMEHKLEPEEIQGEIRAQRGHMKRCYDQLLKSQPDAAGTINVRFEIDNQGRASNVSSDPSTTLVDPTFETCMHDVFRGIEFPASGLEGTTTVTYPLVLTP